VGERQTPWNAEPVAEEIAEMIRNGKQDPRLKWYGSEKVQVRVGQILPKGSAVKQTLEGRRKRLRQAIRKRLADSGWQELKANVYQRS
jgi:hypothetical protein